MFPFMQNINNLQAPLTTVYVFVCHPSSVQYRVHIIIQLIGYYNQCQSHTFYIKRNQTTPKMGEKKSSTELNAPTKNK